MIGAGVVDQRLRRGESGAIVAQILVEEREQILLAPLCRRVAVPLEIAQRGSVVIRLAVPPRAHHQEVAARLPLRLRLQRFPGVDRAIHILLVEQALFPHGRHVGRVGRDQLVERLPLPETIIGRVLHHALPVRQVGIARLLGPRTGRADAAELLVIVVDPGHAFGPGALEPGLLAQPRDVGEAKRAVVEPIVAHPPVDHRAFGRRDLQRRVRVQQRHNHRQPLVGGAKHADAAVGFGQVRLVHQPVDRVISVGGVIHLGRVQRADHRAGDDIIAFRAVFAADVLEHPDVPGANERLVRLRQQRRHVRAVLDAIGAPLGIVGRARQQDRGVRCALGNDDDGEQLGAVAHRDHHLAPHIVARRGRIGEVRGHIASGRWRLLREGRGQRQRGAGKQQQFLHVRDPHPTTLVIPAQAGIHTRRSQESRDDSDYRSSPSWE